ncbi:PaaI family thioesterase [Roseateles sp. NT4]|uniref:PaaI family thioesterase n=1 Tax=Roseateles sp. NT4 TaxID=3453715 RepID=UPI003EEDD7BE
MQVDLDTLRGFFRSAPFMVDLGVEPTAVEPGRVSTQLVVAKRHCQHTGVVHAGVVAALADHTMGAAAQTMAADGRWVLTAEFKTSLLRGASGERLECEAWVIKPGRQVSFTEAEVYAVQGGERRLVAKASGTMAVTKAE